MTENTFSSNRSAILGSVIAALGLFFLPILEIKPDLINTGVFIRILEVQNDLRYIAFFTITLIPLVIAFDSNVEKRAGLLVGLGTVILAGALLMPAIYAKETLAEIEAPLDATTEQTDAARVAREAYFDYLPAENLRFSNPRALPTGGIMAAALGGYIILFAGMADLERSKKSRSTLILSMLICPIIIVYLFVDHHLDSYSVVEEYRTRGAELQVFVFEHLSYVLVAIFAGLIIGIGQGLWAARDERIAPIILYGVGIIQTIPSLALFGLLLVPLANLGDQTIPDLLPPFLLMLMVATIFVIMLLTFQRYKSRLEHQGRLGITASQQLGVVITALTGVTIAIPVALFTIIFVGLSFRVVRIMLVNDQFDQLTTSLVLLVLLGMGTWVLRRVVRGKLIRKRLLQFRAVLFLLIGITLLRMIIDAARIQLQRVDLAQRHFFPFDSIPILGSLSDGVWLNVNWLDTIFIIVLAIFVLAVLGLSGLRERLSHYILHARQENIRRDIILQAGITAILGVLAMAVQQDTQSVIDALDLIAITPTLMLIFAGASLVVLVFFILMYFSETGGYQQPIRNIAQRLFDNEKTVRRILSRLMVAGFALVFFVGILDFATYYQSATVRDLGVSGIGVAPAIIALTLYSLLPLVRNTYAGLKNVDPAIIDAGRGVGMTPAQIFFEIELPLATPVIVAGIRNATVALVGIATIAAIIGGGGLGEYVLQGIDNATIDQILLGAIPAVILAFSLDWLIRIVEILITSPGIRQVQS